MAKLSDQISRILNESVKKSQSDTILRRLGEVLTNNILRRTRSGYGVSEEGSRQERLKPLSKTYVKQRRSLSRNGKLSTETDPDRSNLTKTGEMLDSLTYKVGNKTVSITVSGRENKIKVEANAGRGREFLHLTDKDLEQVEQIIDDFLSRLLS